ncbi:hypothetical protein [Henriciella sp.]|uniref:hypothetical protein n=1 Tax=Henriciella sp. TaxID=1968823 RepID=UPI0026289DB0|nr:hypothetical protein [Henriciella sp.]
MNLQATFTAFFAATLGLGTAACQTGGERVPATLTSPDEATLASVKEVLSDALGRARIRLGPEDLTASTSLSVLPPPLGPNETRSPAVPTHFDIVTNGSACFLVRQETGESYRLDGISCQPVP